MQNYFISSPKSQPKFYNPFNQPNQFFNQIPNQQVPHLSPQHPNHSPMRQRTNLPYRRLSPPLHINNRSPTPPFRLREPSNGGNMFVNSSLNGPTVYIGPNGIPTSINPNNTSNSGTRDNR